MCKALKERQFFPGVCVSQGDVLLLMHLFVQTVQLHLQGLEEALPLRLLALRSSQSLVTLLHLVLHRLQLGTTQTSHINTNSLKHKHTHTQLLAKGVNLAGSVLGDTK